MLVSGERPLLPSSPKAQSAASSVLMGERLDRVGDDASDVLRQVPGVTVQSTGSSAELATISIRGAAGAHTPVYLAGIRLNDELSGAADLSTLPLWMVQRVEVYRGNAPASADRLGLAGAVFFEPERARGNRLGSGLGIGSYGERFGWLSAAVGGADASALIALRRSQAENDYPFLDDAGQRFDLNEVERRRVNADFVAHDAWAVGEFHAGRTRLVSVSHAFDREQGVSGFARTPASAARARKRRQLAGLSAQTPCDSEGRCDLSLQTSALFESTTLRDPLGELPNARARWLNVQARRLSQSARLDWSFDPAWDAGLGVHHTADTLELVRLGNLPRESQRQSFSGSFDLNARPWSPLVLHGLIAVRCTHHRGRYEVLAQLREQSFGACTQSSPDGRLGAAFELTPSWWLLANLSQTSREPTLGELYGLGPGQDGNPSLLSEKGQNLDLGVRAQSGRAPIELGLDAFVFARWVENLVAYRRTSLNAFAPYNVGRARLLGAELALASEWYQHVATHTVATLLDPRDTSRDAASLAIENDVLPLSPRLVASQLVEVFGEFPEQGISRAAFGVRYFYRANRFLDPAGLIALPEQHLWDLHANVALRHPELKLSLSVDNLFDARALDLIGLPLPARAYHASIEAWW